MGRVVTLMRRHHWWWVPPAVGIMLGLGVWVVLDAMGDRDATFEELQRSVATERARTGQVLEMQEQLDAANATIANLEEQVRLLVEQVASLGGVPVVVVEEHSHPEEGDTNGEQGEQGEPGEQGPPGPRGPPGGNGGGGNDDLCVVPFLCLGPLVAGLEGLW